jgi:ABC-type transport system involved in multi-copper enzyme maturation permease subunit
MSSPYPVDQIVNLSMGGGQTFTMHQYYPDVGLAVLVEIIWLVVTVTIGFVAFKRREMVS